MKDRKPEIQIEISREGEIQGRVSQISDESEFRSGKIIGCESSGSMRYFQEVAEKNGKSLKKTMEEFYSSILEW